MDSLHIKKTNLLKTSTYLIYLAFFMILSESIWFSFRHFNIGVVGETESVIIAFYIFAALLSLGILGHILLDKQSIIKQYLSHPLPVFFFFIAIISFIFSFLTPLPIRSWFGSFTTGEGVFSYLGLTLCIISGFFVRHNKNAYKIAGLMVLLSTLFITFMQYFGDDIGLYRPYPMFNSFLAFFGLFLLPILFCTFKPKKNIYSVAIIILSIGIVFLSDNRTALIALFCTILVFLFFLLLSYKKVKHLRLYASILVLLAPVSIGLVTYTIGAYVYKKTENKSLASMYTRYNMHYSIIQYVKDASITGKLFGNGWGGYQDIKKRELPYYRVNLYNVHPMDRELLYDTHFHSHHSVLEALFSIGIVGALFIWLLPVLIIWFCPGRYLLLAIWTSFFYSSLSSMWFQLPLTAPFMVFAFTCLPRNKVYYLNSVIKKVCNILKIRNWVLGVIFIALLTAAYTLYQKRAYRPIDHLAWNKAYYLSEYGKNWYDVYPDYYLGGQRLAYIYDLYNRQLLQTKNNKKLMPQEINSFMLLQKLIDEAIKDNKAGIALQVIDMEYINKWHQANMPVTKNNIVINEMFNNWHDRLKTLLARVPKRTDLAVPYLELQLKNKNYNIIEEIIGPVLQSNPNDPVGLWFKAKVIELKDKDMNKARLLKKQAFENHINNIINVREN